MSWLAPEQDDTQELPVVYSPEHITQELHHWRLKLKDARAGTGSISEKACLDWLDRWLDAKAERRGR